MAVATDTAIRFETIEERMDELGYETELTADEVYIRVGDKEITISASVEDGLFRPETVTDASYFFGIMGKDVTDAFAEADGIEDFVYAVQDAMSVSFMAR